MSRKLLLIFLSATLNDAFGLRFADSSRVAYRRGNSVTIGFKKFNVIQNAVPMDWVDAYS